MNTKRIIFWLGFAVVLALIVWGMITAMNKPATTVPNLGTPAPVTASDHTRGPADAPVTIIEYSDFQCPACEAYFPVVEQIMASSTVPVRLVYRHFPLPQHANARITAQASEAAALQGKFWEMYEIIFKNHTEWTELADAKPILDGYAEKIGLNVTKYRADLESDAVKAAVQKSVDEGQTLGISYTPTFFVNGKVIENPQGYEPFKTIIEAAASGSTK